MREAYSLLRQSIIHVEQDDIDFDHEEEEISKRQQEELEKEQRKANRGKRAGTGTAEESQDVEMSAIESGTIDESEQTLQSTDPAGPSGATSSRAPSMAPEAQPAPEQPKKPRMIITHDKYMQLQSLIVLHLNQVERETGRGMDQDDLVDWYLEQKEAEIESVEQLEYEKELIIKMLKKLVRVSPACIISRYDWWLTRSLV